MFLTRFAENLDKDIVIETPDILQITLNPPETLQSLIIFSKMIGPKLNTFNIDKT